MCRSHNDPVSRVSHTGASSATGAGLSSNPIYDGRQRVERKSRRKSLIDWIANLGLSSSSNSIEDKVSPAVSLKNNKLSRRRSGAMGEGVSAADQIAASVGLPRVLSGKEMRLLKKGPESFKTSNVSAKTTVISTDKRASPSQPEASQQKLPVKLGRRATLASPYSDQGHASNLERHSLSMQQSGEPVTSNNLPLSHAPAHIQSASDKAPWPSAMSSVGASSSSTVISQTSSVCEKTELTSTPSQMDRMRLTSLSSICGPAPATSAEVPEHVDSPTQVSQPSHLSLSSPRRPAEPPPSTLDTSHLSPRARCKGPTADGVSFSVSRPTRFTPPGSPLDNLVSPSSLSRSLAASGRSRAMAHQELEAGVQPAHSVQPTLPGWLMD
ncbi:hypothetical protein CEUSTIGMA_g1713.t1 [Chlamydomonas eustigma]|uniref:Uncharacterized protein n=1 Tax=Chlamydomonas eustigma TaxID=1157962 RepID=A0A250WTX6_9CHLO|nr:hypothetical protein CEUSTIGMA_g1713.t1 [Chlamydomonas eustigma]|eukprot:GAX74264.1 hypothetical protein CEUSTIGMA_g1713.t1 [Chlamydomonas eustigma]